MKSNTCALSIVEGIKSYVCALSIVKSQNEYSSYVHELKVENYICDRKYKVTLIFVIAKYDLEHRFNF